MNDESFSRSDRLSNVYLLVSSTSFPSNTDLSAAADYSYQLGNTTGLLTINIPFGINGRYVRIQKSGTNPSGNYLNIYELQIHEYVYCDTDGDLSTNYFDLDSDNDSCFDAIEGAESFTSSDVDGIGALAGGIDGNGIPSVTSGEQATSSDVTNPSVSSQCEVACTTVRTNRHISRIINN
jgi:hypothetical protein